MPAIGNARQGDDTKEESENQVNPTEATQKETYIIAIDQGTTSSRSLLVDTQGNALRSFQEEFTQIYPQPGWVEHDPMQIWQSVKHTLDQLAIARELSAENVAAIGITNQRETTMIWRRDTGEPIANAIVWQCRRTAEMVNEICGDEEIAAQIKAKTGLLPDAYFSASKIKWILDHVPGAWDDARAGKLAFGTVDTWILWNLTDGAVHATDYTNASRTMLFNIHTLEWDAWLLDLFGIPASILPEVHPSAFDFGTVASGPLAGTRIASLVGDQQAALFGQCCFESGQAKATYGTGCFLLVNTGEDACESNNGLLTTIAASAPQAGVTYALEGSVLNCGTLVQWLRDNLGIVTNSAETEAMAKSVEDAAGVYIVPAFTGLGAPYWNPNARGAILGLTRGVNRAHICRAALEAIAFQNYDLVKAMEADAGQTIRLINVDGGVSNNGFCMQFQADILQTTLLRPASVETTALGAAFLAGLQTGYYESTDYLLSLRSNDDVFEPQMDDKTREAALAGWRDAIERVM